MSRMMLLFESASGYALFDVVEVPEIAVVQDAVQKSYTDLSRFSKVCKLSAFQPFKEASEALKNINDISEGIMNENLENFLVANLPKIKPGKKAKFVLGVSDPSIGKAISEGLNFPCVCSETALEFLRGVRMHFDTIVGGLGNGNMVRAQLGLGHSYSRAKVKFNVNRSDNMIIQSIATLDQLDKDVNTFAMRVREWYSWHFPELIRIVADNFMFARCAAFIRNKSTLNESKLDELTEITMDEEKSKAVIQAAKSSMGMDISDMDMLNIVNFTERLVKLGEYRKQLAEYLSTKMDLVAPNLGALIGDTVAARLISHAGSLTNLAKCPASTVQILGAEKALFRALKTRGNTPKYGLIFHSSFISRASAKNKGRISRYLANKCSMASRIDSFSDEPTTKYGDAMRDQVEQRLEFYASGATPAKNIDVMRKVASTIEKPVEKSEADEKKKKKKRKSEGGDVDEKTPSKKKKKRKSESGDVEEKTPKKTPKSEKKKDKDAEKTPKSEKKKKDKDGAKTPKSEKKKKRKSTSE